MSTFSGKLAVLTGGSSGIGREAVQLAAEGCNLAICATSADKLAETQCLCGQGEVRSFRVGAALSGGSLHRSAVVHLGSLNVSLYRQKLFRKQQPVSPAVAR